MCSLLLSLFLECLHWSLSTWWSREVSLLGRIGGWPSREHCIQNCFWKYQICCWLAGILSGEVEERRYFDMNYFHQLTIIDIWFPWLWSHQAWGIKSSWLLDFQGISCWVSLWLCIFYSFHLKVKRSTFWILLKYRLLETVITWF